MKEIFSFGGKALDNMSNYQQISLINDVWNEENDNA